VRPEIKKWRDRARFEKYGGMELVKELMLELPPKKSYSKGHVFETAMLVVSRRIKRRTKQKRFLAKTIVRQAVGNGYLHPQEKKYSLTKRGRKLIAEAVEKAKEKVLMVLDNPSVWEGDRYTVIVEVDREELEETHDHIGNGFVFYLTERSFLEFAGCKSEVSRFGQEIDWNSLPEQTKRSLAKVLFRMNLIKV
jgi:hypothetical protein